MGTNGFASVGPLQDWSLDNNKATSSTLLFTVKDDAWGVLYVRATEEESKKRGPDRPYFPLEKYFYAYEHSKKGDKIEKPTTGSAELHSYGNMDTDNLLPEKAIIQAKEIKLVVPGEQT